MALLTDDADWEEEWAKPPGTPPEFNVVSALQLGDAATLLVFFSNPVLRDGRANILCDIRITRPNGIVSEAGPLGCFNERIAGPVENLYLTGMQVVVIAEPGDPSGLWVLDIGVRDKERGVRVPLRMSIGIDSTGSVTR